MTLASLKDPAESSFVANPDVCFFLSAGRTGTVFLSGLLSRMLPDVVVRHEPFPARYELMLGNLRKDWGVGDHFLRWIFQKSRAPKIRSAPYIELNPFLCPATDLLAELSVPFNIVHIVRDPLSWAKSMTAFRASRKFRPFIGMIPFAKPFPSPRPAGWHAMQEIERSLWRWRYCNSSILEIENLARNYALVRYEDLFSADRKARSVALDRIVALLPRAPKAPIEEEAFFKKLNPAPDVKDKDDISKDTLYRICGDLMQKFGYPIA